MLESPLDLWQARIDSISWRTSFTGMDTPENHPHVVLAKDGAWHEPELIRRGYTLGRLSKARTGFDILAWRDRLGGWHYPKWQFRADGAVLPEVIQILRLFRSRDTLYVMSQFLFREGRHKPLIDLIRSGRGAVAIRMARERARELRAEPQISRKQVDELNRRMRDFQNPVRFVVVSSFLAHWAMVYDPTNNTYCHQYISEGCLVKNRRVAEAIAKALEDKARKSDHRVLPVQKTRTGFRALEDIPATKYSKRWRPAFRTPKRDRIFVPITESGTRESFVDAMVFAAEHRDEILPVVGQCKDRTAARQKLVRVCRVSERQAEAILEMRLHSMTRKSVATMIDELQRVVCSGDS